MRRRTTFSVQVKLAAKFFRSNNKLSNVGARIAVNNNCAAVILKINHSLWVGLRLHWSCKGIHTPASTVPTQSSEQLFRKKMMHGFQNFKK